MASKTEQAPTISAEEKAEARRAQQREQKKRKRAEEKAAKSAIEALTENEQNGVGHGRAPSEAAREDAERSREREQQAQAQPQQAQQTARRKKHDAELVEATEIAVSLRGKKGGAGPKQHAHVRQVVTDMIDGEVTSAKLAEIAGFESMDEIRDYVQGNNEPGTTRAIRQRFVSLDEKMGDDWYTHGMMLASILAAWAVQLDR